MVSTCKKCGGTKEESDAICDYCCKAQEDPSTNQIVGRKAAIMHCKKCGGNKAESDAICDYCRKAQEESNVNRAGMLKLRNRVRPYPRPRKKYKQLITTTTKYWTKDTEHRVDPTEYSRYLKRAS